MHRLIPCLLLVLSACSGDEPASITGPVSTSPDAPELGISLFASGTPREEFQFYLDQGQQIRHGTYRAFYEDGPVQIEGFYKAGRKDSIWTHFDAGGRTTLVHTWRDGRKWDGPFLLYWPNGNPSEYGTYREGQWHGVYTSYYSSGKLEIRAQFVDDELHGSYLEFYESGNRKVRGAYWKGLKDGLWVYYAESGLELQREEHHRGALESTGRVELETYDNGSLLSVTPYRENQIHGVYIEYWPNGQKREERTYDDGLAHGLAFSYWDNGQIKARGNYSRGRKQGQWQTYNNAGALTLEAGYDRGLLSGPYTSYHSNGNRQWVGTYLRGIKNGLWTNYTRDSQKRLQQLWGENKLLSVLDCREEECQ